MADETLLSDLCSICNTNKSKYCCPGCAARTCSLPCYKRHQQWAQCTGKRDPTAYVKKSQLATPAGIDHDYNFLTSIERGLEKASREVKAKGVEVPSPGQQRGKSGVPGWYADAGVTLIPAPKGLSRQRENQTRLSQRKNIIWTVEWIDSDNSRCLSNTNEKQSILEAYLYRTGKAPSKKRKREGEDSSLAERGATRTCTSKDERGEAQSEARTGTVYSDIEETGSGTEGVRLQPDTAKPETTATKEKDQGVEAEPTLESPLTARESDSKSKPQSGVPITEQKDQPEVAEVAGPNAEPEAPQPDYYFFLHKPRTSSDRHVVTPVTPSETLRATLRSRTVLEFPTIYVFTNPSPPTDTFILEEEYLKQEKQEQQELEDALKSVQPGTLQALNEGGSGEQAGDELDSKRILDVLKRDLGGGF